MKSELGTSIKGADNYIKTLENERKERTGEYWKGGYGFVANHDLKINPLGTKGTFDLKSLNKHLLSKK